MMPANVRRTRGPESPVDLWRDDFNRLFRQWWGDGADGNSTGIYPVDIREDQDFIYVDAELPGFRREEVEVTLENGLLSIVAQRKGEERQGEQHLNERRFTRVARSFSLPNTVDEGKVEARLEDGVLHLKLHKREEVKPRRIEVK